MRKFRIIHLLICLFVLACSEDGGEFVPEATCADGIQNGDETGVDCGGSCDACEVACTDEVSYPEEGTFGINILREAEGDTLVINPVTFTSMLANTVESCTEVKVIIQYVEGAGCEGCWFYAPPLTRNWNVLTYDFDQNKQIFISTSEGISTDDTKELPIFGFVDGLYEIRYFINDSLTHTNYLSSVAIGAESWVDSEPIYYMTADDDLLYVNSLEGNYFGTINLQDEAPQVSNRAAPSSNAMAVREGELYYFDFAQSSINKRDLVGGGDPEVVLTDITQTFEMVFNGDQLIFTDDFFSAEGERSILTVDVTDPELQIQDLVTGLDNPMSFSIVGDTFYFLDGNKKAYSLDLTTAGAEPELLFLFPNQFGTPDMFGLAVHNDEIYYSAVGTIARIDPETLEITTLVAMNVNSIFFDLHVEDNYVIFTSPLDQVIYKKEL